jgi:3-methyladenine DNA glycosylase/8-oxoguanine DNA glycosylase
VARGARREKTTTRLLALFGQRRRYRVPVSLRRSRSQQHSKPNQNNNRWRKTGPHTYTGVVGRRVFQLRQQPSPAAKTAAAAAKTASAAPAGQVCWRLASRPPNSSSSSSNNSNSSLTEAEAALLDYLNLGPDRPKLAELARGWAATDARYRAVAAALPGARMLRQAPLECLFSFVCSSNNHISRIHGMVERLCARYGSAIELEPWAERELAALALKGQVVSATPATLGDSDEEEEAEEGAAAADKEATEAAWAAALGGGGGPGEQEDVVVRVELATPPPATAGKGGKRRAPSSPPSPGAPAAAGATGAGSAAPAFWAFPSLEQLAAASEEALRADGFG